MKSMHWVKVSAIEVPWMPISREVDMTIISSFDLSHLELCGKRGYQAL